MVSLGYCERRYIGPGSSVVTGLPQNPFHFTVAPMLPFGDTKKKLRDDYAAMLQAFGWPVLEWEELVKKVGLRKVVRED